MSRLTVYPEDDPVRVRLDTAVGSEIAARLAQIDVMFERWRASEVLGANEHNRAVMKVYGRDIERLKLERGYRAVDVVRCSPNSPQRHSLRQKFLEEHTHDEDEVRFFVEGAAVFYLRSGGSVFRTLCERGDLLSVPAGTRHWFDMGPAPLFTAIRFFTTPAGWIAKFTGDCIAQRFPGFDGQLL